MDFNFVTKKLLKKHALDVLSSDVDQSTSLIAKQNIQLLQDIEEKSHEFRETIKAVEQNHSAEKAKLMEMINSLKAQVQNLKHDKHGLESQNQRLKHDKQDLESHNQRLESKLQKLESQNQSIQAKYAESTKELEMTKEVLKLLVIEFNKSREFIPSLIQLGDYLCSDINFITDYQNEIKRTFNSLHEALKSYSNLIRQTFGNRSEKIVATPKKHKKTASSLQEENVSIAYRGVDVAKNSKQEQESSPTKTNTGGFTATYEPKALYVEDSELNFDIQEVVDLIPPDDVDTVAQKNRENIDLYKKYLEEPCKAIVSAIGSIDTVCTTCGEKITLHQKDSVYRSSYKTLTTKNQNGISNILAGTGEYYCPQCRSKIKVSYGNTKGISVEVSNDSNTKLSDDFQSIFKSITKDQVFDVSNKKELNKSNRFAQKAMSEAIRLSSSGAKYEYCPEIKRDEFGQLYVVPDNNLHVAGYHQIFRKGKLTIGKLSQFIHLSLTVGASFSKAEAFVNDADGDISKSALITNVIAFSRAFIHNVVEEELAPALYSNPCFNIDESPMLVRKLNSEADFIDNGSEQDKYIDGRRCQIWAVNTTATAKEKVCLYHIARSRSGDIAKHFMTEALEHNPEWKGFTADGLASYDSAVQDIFEESNGNIKIQRQMCWTHARRSLVNSCQASPDWHFYTDLLAQDKFYNMDEELKKLYGEGSINQTTFYLFRIVWLISVLFHIESIIKRNHKNNLDSSAYLEECARTRQTVSTKVVDQIFVTILHLWKSEPSLFETTKRKNGKYLFRKGSTNTIAGDLLALVNHQQDLREFITNPHLDICQTSTERSVRKYVTNKKVFLFKDTEDGATAYSDLLTIADNVKEHNVPFEDYLIWLLVSVKERIREATGNCASLNMPSTASIKTDDGVIVNRLYGDTKLAGFDDISFKGLSPKYFAKYLAQKRS